MEEKDMKTITLYMQVEDENGRRLTTSKLKPMLTQAVSCKVTVYDRENQFTVYFNTDNLSEDQIRGRIDQFFGRPEQQRYTFEWR
jgi:hypothetical protein